MNYNLEHIDQFEKYLGIFFLNIHNINLFWHIPIIYLQNIHLERNVRFIMILISNYSNSLC